MNIKKLHEITAEIIAKGGGHRGVCISKDTFRHKLESDGATILSVESGSLEQFEMADDDGGTKTRADGSTVYGMALVLAGNEESGHALKHGNWISVADKLPTHLHTVLGYITSGGLVVMEEKMMDCVSYDPERKAWLQCVNGDDAVVTVSHWMHLPYPPTKRTVAKWTA